MRKSILAAIISAVTITSSPQVAQAVEHDNYSFLKVSQGDVFKSQRGEKIGDPEGDVSEVITISCTIGYIDHNLRRAYTAGHCGTNGSEVTDKDENVIGTFYSNPNYNEKNYRNDQAYIQLNKNIIAGKNYYSGDETVSLNDLSTGDTLCSYGASSDKIHCGILRTVDERNIIGDGNTGGIHGDSGGPAWVPGKGFVGVFSATFYNGKEEKNRINYAQVFNSIYGESKTNKGSNVRPLKKYDKGEYSYDLKQIIDTSHIYFQTKFYRNSYEIFIKDVKKHTNDLIKELASKSLTIKNFLKK